MPQILKLAFFAFWLLVNSLAQAADRPLPRWVLTPPTDDAEFMYGVGEGSSVERAEQDALKGIAGKLSTEVRSATNSRASKQDGEVSRYFTEDVQTSVQGIKLSDYTVVRTVPRGDVYYSLVKMSRPGFVRTTRLRLDELDQTIRALSKDAEASSKLRRLVGYRALLPKIEEATGVALVLQVADPTFDARSQLATYHDFKKRALEVQGKTRILVKCSPGLEPVAEQVARFLAEAEIGTTQTLPADGVVELIGKVTRQELFSMKNVQGDVEIVTRELNGVALKRHSYHVNGSAVSSYDTALRNAAADFGKEGESLLSQIGLQ